MRFSANHVQSLITPNLITKWRI